MSRELYCPHCGTELPDSLENRIVAGGFSTKETEVLQSLASGWSYSEGNRRAERGSEDVTIHFMKDRMAEVGLRIEREPYGDDGRWRRRRLVMVD